jgi:subtilase family serine protease
LNRTRKAPIATPALALAALVASLTACGGGASTEDQAAAADVPAAASIPSADAGAAEAEIAQSAATPTYHMAPAVLADPADADAGGTNASAAQEPQRFTVEAAAAGLSTRGLTPQALAAHLSNARAHAAAAGSDTSSPAAAAITGAVYTPAQIRAAYGLPNLPAVGASLSATQAANLGAGQTLYIIDAYHDASALTDLNLFSARFGLPACTSAPVATGAALPLAAAPSSCTLSVVYATSSGTMTATAPAYLSSWAPESKLDVQWAHAIAPLARIVLIETADAMTNNLLGGIALANRMGSGVVSMSFGLADPGWASTVDSKFTTAGMTYVAATGDVGGKVDWPAVSPNVLAVGGTAMNWTPSTSTRYELAWANGGGGVSAYGTVPSWQTGVTLAGAKLAHRAVADVSFNASPMTGQYVALTLPGASTVWAAYGGTSIGSPQWAGVLAVANAVRKASGKAALGDVHNLLYGSIGAVPGNYAAAFGDVLSGTNGTCGSACTAGTGYDAPTGWGTPNVNALMPMLTGVATAAAAAAAPALTVPGGAIAGRAAVALSNPLGISAPAGSAYALIGAPAGATVDASGTLKWTSPVAGTYTFTAKVASGSSSASGTYSLKVIPNAPPVFAGSASLAATLGSGFSTTVSATDPNGGTIAYSASGLASGMTLASNGAFSWSSPTAGSHGFTVTATDSYGLSASRAYTVTVAAANHAPTLTSMSIVDQHAAALAVTLRGRDVDGDAMSYTMAGAPAGVTLTSAGVLAWAHPVKGTYPVAVTVHDSHGATGGATITLIVS